MIAILRPFSVYFHLFMAKMIEIEVKNDVKMVTVILVHEHPGVHISS